MSAPSGIPLIVQVSRDVVTVRNLETGESIQLGYWGHLQSPGIVRIAAASLSGDGKWLAIGRADRNQIEVRAPLAPREQPPQYITNLENPGDPKAEIRGIEFSPDGQYLAAVSYGGTGQVFKLGKRKLNSQLSFDMTGGKVSQFRALKFSPDSRWLATLSSSGLLKLIGVGGRKRPEHSLSNSEVVSVAFTQDSKFLMVNTRNGVKVWNTEKAAWSDKKFDGLAFGFEIAYHWIFVSNSVESNAVFAYEIRWGKMTEILPHKQRTLTLPSGVAQAVGRSTTFALVPPRAFASGMDGRYLLMGDELGAVRVFDTRTFQEVVSFFAFPLDDSQLDPGTVINGLWKGDAHGTVFYVRADNKTVHVPVPANVDDPNYETSAQFYQYRAAQTSDQSRIQWVRRFSLQQILASPSPRDPLLN